MPFGLKFEIGWKNGFPLKTTQEQARINKNRNDENIRCSLIVTFSILKKR